MKINFVVIPLIVLAVAIIGSKITSTDVSSWYKTIKLPDWTPAGSVIGTVWSIIFILSAISILIVWNRLPHNSRFWWIVAIFVANAVLNVGWSWLFFGQHFLGLAVLGAALLDASVIILIILIWPFSIQAALLLTPYAAWVAFATFLTFKVWSLN